MAHSYLLFPGATNNSYVQNIHGPESFSKNEEQREGDDDGVLYTNLEKPVSVMFADFENYLSDCENGRHAKLEQQFQVIFLLE